eukprot:TRINITY_DN25888_c0_g2_i1.p1 TRINITY_DN25888_c0_g2~~TRINITY_DN25888_c0_g2_i1.p1  ORF type:complete len:270 (+),score=57.79 TRINITY_DN25888_c0_g2_i1:127-936(+)
MVLTLDLSTFESSNLWKEVTKQENKLQRQQLAEECGPNGDKLLPPPELLPEEGGLPRPAPPRRFLKGNPHYPTSRMPLHPHLCNGIHDGGKPAMSYKALMTGPSLPSMMGLAQQSSARQLIGGAADHHMTDWATGEAIAGTGQLYAGLSEEGSSAGSGSRLQSGSAGSASASRLASRSGLGSAAPSSLSRGSRGRTPFARSLPDLSAARNAEEMNLTLKPTTGASRRSRRSTRTLSSAATSLLIKQEVDAAVQREMRRVLGSTAQPQVA